MTERQRQERRIKRFLKNAESRGFEFNKAHISELIKTTPENGLNKITPNLLYSFATYVVDDTGEILSKKLEHLLLILLSVIIVDRY